MLNNVCVNALAFGLFDGEVGWVATLEYGNEAECCTVNSVYNARNIDRISLIFVVENAKERKRDGDLEHDGSGEVESIE